MKKEKRQKIVISKDKTFEKIINSKSTYIVLGILVLIYTFQKDKILNLPKNIFWITTVVALCLEVFFFLWRYKKYKVYYQRKVKDCVYIVSMVYGVLIFTFLLQGILNIPSNFLINQKANNKTEIFYCKITNVIKTNIDKIHFEFKGKIYSRYFTVKDYTKNDLINNYSLKIEARKSIWDTYYIEKMSIEKK